MQQDTNFRDALQISYQLGLLQDDDASDHEIWLWTLVAGMLAYYGVLVALGRSGSVDANTWFIGIGTIAVARAVYLRRRRAKRLADWFYVRDRGAHILVSESYQAVQGVCGC